MRVLRPAWGQVVRSGRSVYSVKTSYFSRARSAVRRICCLSSDEEMPKNKWYAVRQGRQPGVYRTWPECQKQVNKFGGAVFKSFPTREEAYEFSRGGDSRPSTKSSSSKASSSSKRSRGTTEHENARPEKVARGGRYYTLMFDGGSRGNPGKGGSGACLYTPDDRLYWEGAFYQGHCTNNEAEYEGLIEGLRHAKKAKCENLKVMGDSDLIIRQMKGVYQVKNERLKAKYKKAKELVKAFDDVQYEHVYRHLNTKADSLANRAMDYECNDGKWFDSDE